MPLDFIILSEDGSADHLVALSIEQHNELIAHACELKLFRILRFKDYFEDIDTSPLELPGLKTEIASMQRAATSNETRAFLRDLYRLIELAIRQRRTVHAIAD